jgi:hypothetical protein
MLPSTDSAHLSGMMSGRQEVTLRSSRHKRILACTSCQLRKVKCDRKFPCSNCVKARVQCVQATLAPRRRRFSERALLERVHKYEELLRQHKIPFDPLHSPRRDDSFNVDASDDSQDEQMEHVADKVSTSSNHEKEESGYEPKCALRKRLWLADTNFVPGTYFTP